MTREDGLTEIVFALDEQLEISGLGLISMNMVEQMVSGIIEMSYREIAEKITEMTGQSIKIKFTFYSKCDNISDINNA